MDHWDTAPRPQSRRTVSGYARFMGTHDLATAAGSTPPALIVTACASAMAAFASLTVAILSYRAQQPRVRTYLRWERVTDADGSLVIEVANAGRMPCTILRIGFAHGRRLLRQETLHGDVWTYAGPGDDGTLQRHRLGEFDATSWHVASAALRGALGDSNPAAVRAFAQLGDGRLIRSKPLMLRSRPPAIEPPAGNL